MRLSFNDWDIGKKSSRERRATVIRGFEWVEGFDEFEGVNRTTWMFKTLERPELLDPFERLELF